MSAPTKRATAPTDHERDLALALRAAIADPATMGELQSMSHLCACCGAPNLPADDLLVTITIAIERDGSVHQDTQCHGNRWADVYRGMHGVKAEVERLIADRRECPFNPKNTPVGGF